MRQTRPNPLIGRAASIVEADKPPGVPAQVTFSGLAPGFVGLNQVNAIGPPGAPIGSAVAVQLEIGGIQSNTVTIAIGRGAP